jgi:hypothetical protein
MNVLVHKSKGKWRVYADGTYTEHDEVFLKNVSFFVIPELQIQVRETKKKVPHAYAQGELLISTDVSHLITTYSFPIHPDQWQEFDYDVFTQDSFTITEGNMLVSRAAYVYLGPKHASLTTQYS